MAPPAPEGVGICQAGTATCNADGSGFGKCVGEVTPQSPTCSTTADTACTGHNCVQWAELLGSGQYAIANAIAVDLMGKLVHCRCLHGHVPPPAGDAHHHLQQ